METKDIDFEQPHIRKKIYKAYISYIGGDGKIGCYYQANQSETWTAATVAYDDLTAVSTAGYLNDSTTLKRATLTFGTGGNNVYSFALRFKTDDGIIINDLSINDISVIYRQKKPN